MNGPARRLAAFAVILVASFGIAYAIGESLPEYRHPPAQDRPAVSVPATHGGHGG